MSLQIIVMTEICSSTYRYIEKIHIIETPHKSKTLLLFDINACSLNKNCGDFQHLLTVISFINKFSEDCFYGGC